MPFQPALPTWLAINNMNSVSPSGQTDNMTGYPYEGGGLNLGDYFDLTKRPLRLIRPTDYCIQAVIVMCRLIQALPLQT